MNTSIKSKSRKNAVAPIKKRKESSLAWPIRFYSTSVGKKYAMAISGIILLGFIFGHMLGNLKMYLGAKTFDHYAEFLREIGEPLLPRTVLLWIVFSIPPEQPLLSVCIPLAQLLTTFPE